MGQREGGGGGEGVKPAGGRADRDSHKIDPLCASPPRDRRHRHRHHRCSPVAPPLSSLRRCPLCLFSKLCSQFTSDQVSALRFYANPMPMSCNRRGEPLSLRRMGTEGDFIFRGSFTAVLCFKVTTFLLSSVRLGARSLARSRASSIVPCISLRPLAFPRPRPHPSSPSPLCLDPVPRNSALTSIRGRLRR